MVTLRPLADHQRLAASELCLRSKAHWGYDEAFLAACRDELTITAADLARDPIVAALLGDGMVGVAQVTSDATGCFLEKLFVSPGCMGQGIGRRLFLWSIESARGLGARELVIDADPQAVPFYERLGCVRQGSAPSCSIPGRRIPRLIHSLSPECPRDG